MFIHSCSYWLTLSQNDVLYISNGALNVEVARKVDSFVCSQQKYVLTFDEEGFSHLYDVKDVAALLKKVGIPADNFRLSQIVTIK